jgi:hypothetical protein
MMILSVDERCGERSAFSITWAAGEGLVLPADQMAGRGALPDLVQVDRTFCRGTAWQRAAQAVKTERSIR